MYKFITLILVLLIFCSCKNTKTRKPEPNAPQNHQEPEENNARLTFSEPVQIDSSAYVMYPLEIKKEDDGYKAIGSSGSGSTAYNWNIVFLNTATQTYHLLDSNRKMLIKSFDLDQPSNNDIKTGIKLKYLFYTLIVNDANKNGRLDYEDPGYLFISTKSGNDLKQISPDNYNVVSWKVITQTNKVLIATTRANDDADYDEREIIPFEYNLTNGTLAKKVFDSGFINNVRKLFEKQWKEKKQ